MQELVLSPHAWRKTITLLERVTKPGEEPQILIVGCRFGVGFLCAATNSFNLSGNLSRLFDARTSVPCALTPNGFVISVYLVLRRLWLQNEQIIDTCVELS